MHIYLNAIGLTGFFSRDEINTLIEDILTCGGQKTEYKREGMSSLVEYRKEYAPGIGLAVVGEEDAAGFQFLHYYPFLEGKSESCKANVFYNRRVDIEAFTGMSEDVRIGVSIIYFIQNSIEYIMNRDTANDIKRSVYLAALANEAVIILPIEKKDEYQVEKKKKLEKRTQLIAEAKKGNQGAIECLTLEEIDQYTSVMKRAKTEDLFSIVNTTFMPCGSESDIYNIIGEIKAVELVKNEVTDEDVYIIEIDCNDVPMTVCSAKCKTIGEPKPGRRFKGTVWLQGKVSFE